MTSWQTRTAKLFGRLTIRQSLKRDLSVADMRKRIATMERFIPKSPKNVRIDKEPGLSHCAAEWLTPLSGPTERLILHFPGGAFFTRFERAERALLGRLCHTANARGRLVFYRLAPEHPYPAALEDCLEAYKQLLDLGVDPHHIIVSGMSAGGCLALSTLLAARDQGLPLPAGAILMSPAADMTEHSLDGSRLANAAHDAVLSLERGDDIRRLYLAERIDEVDHPYVSPVFGDYTGLPPLLFQVGSTEILLDDSQRCAERARASGGQATVEVWDRVPHGWQALSFTPEATRAIGHLVDFIRERCP